MNNTNAHIELIRAKMRGDVDPGVNNTCTISK